MTLTEEQREAIRVISKLPMAIGCQLCHPYIMENYGSHFIVLRDMIDSSGTVEPTGGFDLERARGLRDFLQDDCAEVGDVWGEMIAEIERLRPFEMAARDLDSDLTKIAGERDDQAARIKELEDAHKRSGKKYAKIINELRSSVYANIPGLDVGKIGPDAKPHEGLYGKYRISKADGSPVDPGADYFVLRLDSDPVARRAALQYSYMTPDRTLAIGLQEKLTKYNPKMEDCINLQFFGMERPRVWQITEERVAALVAMSSLRTDVDCPQCDAWLHFSDIAEHAPVLRAMLTEAE